MRGFFFYTKYNWDIFRVLDYYQLMNLGFIGTGKIASSVITGISKSSIKYKKIIVSSRNKQVAQNLKKKIKKYCYRKK